MNKNKTNIIDFIAITIAGVINAFGIIFFLYPVNLYDSGISGASMLLAQVTPETMPLSLFLIILNLPLFIYGYKKMGAAFTIRSIYAVFIYSLVAWLITDVLPIDVSVASPLAQSDLLLCAIYGGLISGIGSGLTIRFGGAMDGIEILAVLFAKSLGMTVGVFVMIFNIILYIIAGCVLNSWILPLYSIIAYAAAIKTVDFITEGLDREKAIMIITNKHYEICEALSQEFKIGITILAAEGYYSGSKKKMVYFVVNRFQINKVRNIVKMLDDEAYVTISDITDVYLSNKKEKNV